MAHEQKDRFAKLAFFDQTPINLNSFLTTTEKEIFIYIRRINKTNPKYISWFEFAVNCSMGKQTVFNSLDNLKKLDIIYAKSQNNNGTLYALNSSKIEEILEKLNSLKDIKERYLYGNKIRITAGLKEINLPAIKLITKHKHVSLTDDERGILIEEKVHIETKYNKVNLNNSHNNIQILLSRANEIQHSFSINEIDLNEYNSRINEIKQATNNKIVLDKTKNIWKTK